MMAVKSALWVALLAPAAWLGWHVYELIYASPAGLGPLGADPVEYIVRFLGEWGLRLLVLSLLLSTLARRLKKPGIIRVRRLVGLFAFAYVTSHLAGYIWLLAEARWGEIIADVFDRPYITVGLLGWVVLLPLAITSTRGWQRKLGRNWKRLHQLVYVALLAGVVHLFWLTKDGFAEVVVYAVIAAVLLAERRVKPAR